MDEGSPVRSALAYFRAVFDLISTVQISDAQGRIIGLDIGIDLTVSLLKTTAQQRRKILLVGNGGSAAIAAHLQSDLCKSAHLKAMVFNDIPLLTAMSNDLGYDSIFEGAVRLWAEPADILVAISSSGESINILKGVSAARERQCPVVTLSGFRPGNSLRCRGDVNFYVASKSYSEVEVSHQVIAHLLSDLAAAQHTTELCPSSRETLALAE